VSILGGGWGDSLIFLIFPHYFFKDGGNFTWRKKKKVNKCKKFSLFDTNPPCFSNPRIDTGRA
jgi:hypothetical protein